MMFAWPVVLGFALMWNGALATDCATLCPPIPVCSGGHTSGCVIPVVQSTDVTCWAASTAMLLQIMKGVRVSEAQAAEWGGLASQGPQAPMGNEAGIAPSQTANFIKKLNENSNVRPNRLIHLAASLTIPGMCDVVKHGAIFGSVFRDPATGTPQPGSNINFHIQVIVGMVGDCSDDPTNYKSSGRTKVVIQDPWMGQRREVDFNEFVHLMESQHARLYQRYRDILNQHPNNAQAQAAQEWTQLVFVYFERHAGTSGSFLEHFLERRISKARRMRSTRN